MLRRTLMMAALVVLAMALPTWAADPTSRPESSQIDDLIRQADKVLDKKDTPSPGDTAKPTSDKPTDDPKKDGEEEDDDLATLLLKRAGGENGKPVMVRILDGMADSRGQLREAYDAGEKTQAIQKKIIEGLDEAIEAAKKAQSSPSKDQKKDKGQKQDQGKSQGSKPSGSSPSSGDPQRNNAQSPAGESKASSGDKPENVDPGKPIESTKTEWGGLPDRDRNEVVQGKSEEMVPRWKAVIEKYYTALSVQSSKKD